MGESLGIIMSRDDFKELTSDNMQKRSIFTFSSLSYFSLKRQNHLHFSHVII